MNKDMHEVRRGKHFHFDKNFWDAPVRLGFLSIYQIGELCCEQGFKVDSHEQSVYEITYVISGNGFSFTDGEKVSLTEGDVLINSVGHQHAMMAAESDIFRYAYIGFRFTDDETGLPQDDMVETLKRCYGERPWLLLKNQESLLLPFMQCIDEFYTQTAYSQQMIKNYCEQIVIMAIRGASVVQKAWLHSVNHLRSDSSAVYAAIRYVEKNIFNLSTIQKMAQDLGYSYTYLSHLFREKTGTTLQNYIYYKKIECAVQLLRYGGLTASQVAEMLHYESIQTFSKSFRRIMGVTPTQYMLADRNGERAADNTLFGTLEQAE